MSINYRKRVSAGPLKFQFTQNGLSSVSLKVGPITSRLWSRTQSRRSVSSVNLPGGFSYRGGR